MGLFLWKVGMAIDGIAMKIDDALEIAKDTHDNLKELVNDTKDDFSELNEIIKEGAIDLTKTALSSQHGHPARKMEAGDILAVKRAAGIYYHYAVYIGNDEVIHYAAQEGDFGGIVQRAPFANFKKDSREVFVLDFSENPNDLPDLIPAKSFISPKYPNRGDLIKERIQLRRQLNYQLYSPEETIKRAKSRLGEDQYSLALNNCEHFAIWCKTGVSESHQVNRILEILLDDPWTISF